LVLALREDPHLALQLLLAAAVVAAAAIDAISISFKIVLWIRIVSSLVRELFVRH
jgi:hypothetical protein